MTAQSFHPKVFERLDDWQKMHLSEYFFWQDDGNTPREDIEVRLFLDIEVYNSDVEKQLDTWTRQEYIAWRDKVMRRAFPTVYYGELIRRFAELNLKFNLR